MMNFNQLQRGDYVVIEFPNGGLPQLAEVLNIDHAIGSVDLLPESQDDPIRISEADQRNQIHPVPILCQLLRSIGFYDITLERAYGWTATHWSKTSLDQNYIFNLLYENHTWTLVVSTLEEPELHRHQGIRFFHELQHVLEPYNPRIF